MYGAAILLMTLFAATDAEVNESLVAFEQAGKWGFKDTAGQVVVEPKYDKVGRFRYGLAPVNVGAKVEHYFNPATKTGGKWGYIDERGELIVPISLVYAREYSDGLALVGDERGTRYLDIHGKVAIDLGDIDGAGDFSEGLAPLDQGGQTSFIDKTGRTVFTVNGCAREFSEGMSVLSVRKRMGSRLVDLYGYINRKGKIAIAPRFAEATEFHEGLAAVRTEKSPDTPYGKGDQWGYIDTSGQYVIDPQFNEAHRFHNGIARVHVGGKLQMPIDARTYWEGGEWRLIDDTGKVLKWSSEWLEYEEAVAQDASTDEGDPPVKIERSFSVAAYPFPGKPGDRGSQIVDVFLAGRWIVATVDSGKVVEINAPFTWHLGRGGRISRVIVVNLDTGETKSIVVSETRAANGVQFSRPCFVDRQTIEIELCGVGDDRKVKRCMGRFRWNLKTDDIHVMSSRREGPASIGLVMNSTIGLLMNSTGLSLESLTDDRMSLTDRATGRTLKVPFEDKPLMARPSVYSASVALPLTIFGPGPARSRIVVYESPKAGGPSITAYDPIDSDGCVWRIPASAIERRCAKNRCLAVIPVESMRFPCEVLPFTALFEGQAPSFLILRDGAIDWSCEISQEWDYSVASENERFVAMAIPGSDIPFSAVVVDCKARTISKLIGGDELVNYSVEAISNKGELILADDAQLLVCSYADGRWTRRSIDVLRKPDE